MQLMIKHTVIYTLEKYDNCEEQLHVNASFAKAYQRLLQHLNKAL